MGTLVERFGPALEAAAKKAGVELAGTTWHWETLEQTWGTKMGFVFLGPEAERAAKFCYAWLLKNAKGSYESQNATNPPEACEAAGKSKLVKVGGEWVWKYGEPGAGLWVTPSMKPSGDELTWTPAWKVAAKYYPCAE